MYIVRARIDNVRVISNFDLDLTRTNPAGWHVILGDNGAGKSTVIRSLALALIGQRNAEALRQDWSSWLGDDSDNGSLLLSIRGSSTHDKWVDKGRQSNDLIRPYIRFHQRENDDVTVNFSGVFTKRTVWGGGSGWFSAAFGPFRRFRGGDKDYDKLYYTHPRLAAHLSAFGEDVALSEALQWIKDILLKSLEKDKTATRLLSGLTDFINSSGLLPHAARISEVSSAGIMIDNGAGTKVAVEEMSDGYRSILAMTFELIRSMDAAYGTETLLKALDVEQGCINLPGVVLIDEIDAHLHPAWQKRIGHWFVERFPMIQFFVTTHSPIICQAAERGSIWQLARPGSNEVSGRITGQEFERLVYGNILEAYSTDYFGSDVTRSQNSAKMLRELAELNRKSLKSGLSDNEEQSRRILKRRLPSQANDMQA